MILDTSAFMAVVLSEAERDVFDSVLDAAADVRLSAGSWIEVQAVNTRRFGGKLDRSIETFMARYHVEIVPVTVAHADLARAAYRTYGIGTRHPARLNFGDCFAYALSKATGEPLLFKGDDFALTDMISAV